MTKRVIKIWEDLGFYNLSPLDVIECSFIGLELAPFVIEYTKPRSGKRVSRFWLVQDDVAKELTGGNKPIHKANYPSEQLQTLNAKPGDLVLWYTFSDFPGYKSPKAFYFCQIKIDKDVKGWR